MSVMNWDESLELGNATMDATHREFVELINRLGSAADDEVLAVLDEFLRHTEEHFAEEQRWMQAIDFPPRECHIREHTGVLEVAREVRNRIVNGEARFGNVLARATAEWFANHAAGMDAMLAMYMQQVANGAEVQPGSLPACGEPAKV